MACGGDTIDRDPSVKWVCAISMEEKGVGSDYGEAHLHSDECAMSE